MKIPALPQVEFDDFPTDQNTKVCIFTQPKQNIPDLSQSHQNVQLFCTEDTYKTMGAFPQKLPHRLFRLLPLENTWKKFDAQQFGMEKTFGVATIRTGCVSDSVMILIVLEENLSELLLYTGAFKACRNVLLSKTIALYADAITDIYVDNTLAGSYHFDVTQIERACNNIRKVVDKYPAHTIFLQMELFSSLDLLVQLAQCHRINVRLAQMQQALFHRSKYESLFEFDSKLFPNAQLLNQNCQLKNCPRIFVQPLRPLEDLVIYKKNLEEKKIVHSRLIESEYELDPNEQQDGLIYITFAPHAGAYTLAQLFEIIQPKRVHPTVQYELVENSMSSISEDILNEGCEIVNDIQKPVNILDVHLDDLTKENGQSEEKSFLHTTTSEITLGSMSGIEYDNYTSVEDADEDENARNDCDDDSDSSDSNNYIPNYPD